MSFEKSESEQMKRMVFDGNVRVTIEAANFELEDSETENKNTLPPLRVGILRRNKNGVWKPQHTICAMFYIAKQFNIELCLFSPNDINFEDRTVTATFLEGNEKVQKVIPLPKIIDSTPNFPNTDVGRKLARLRGDYFFTRNPLHTTKQKVYNMLLEDGQFKEFLIETHTVNNLRHFLSLLGKYNNHVILKPLRGARGIGVAEIILNGDKYIVNLSNEKFSLNAEEFSTFYKKHFTEVKHILQPYIVSRTKQNNPFDIRIHARRGAGGKFKVTPFPRIGSANGAVSNISTGGYSMKFETFLQLEFGKDWEMIYNRLIEFGKVFPDYYQSFFKVTLFDIGVDVGIQRRDDGYDFKIFEVNTQIDGPFFEIEDAITYFEYFRYIDQKLREGSITLKNS